MTYQTLTATYTSGYFLSNSYTGVVATASAYVEGRAALSSGSVGGTGYGGGIGMFVGFTAVVINQGVLYGGTGGAGGGDSSKGGKGGYGGVGGPGLWLTSGGAISNSGSIRGGRGGAGAYGGKFAGAGGAGGVGLAMTGSSTLANYGLVQGGYGGPTGTDGTGGGSGTDFTWFNGNGGAGVSITSGGEIINHGTIEGGNAPTAGPFPGDGGNGVLLNSGTLINAGLVTVGQGGEPGFQAVNASNGAVVLNGSSASAAATIAGGFTGVEATNSTVTNWGVLEGVNYGAQIDATTFDNYGVAVGQRAGVEVLGAATFVNHTAGVAKGKYGATVEGGVLVNFGTLSSYSTISVMAVAGRVVAKPGSVFQGLAQGGGVASTLELAEGGGTLAASAVASSVLAGAGGLSFAGFGTVQLDKGTWNLSGGLASGVRLLVENGDWVRASGSFSNLGTIALASGASHTDLEALSAGLTLSGGGQVSMTGTLSRIYGASSTARLVNIDNTIAGHGWLGLGTLSLVNQAKGVIEATGTQGLVVNVGTTTLTNAGLMEAASGSALTMSSDTINQTGGGAIRALSGGRVNLQAISVLGGTLSQAGTGVMALSGVGGLIGAASAVTVAGALEVLNGAALTLDGVINNGGAIDTFASSASTSLIVGSDGLILTGGGQVNLNASLNNHLATGVSGATLTNLNQRISGAGTIGGGGLLLVNGSFGVIAGSTALSLTLDTGANTIRNGGTIETTGTGQVTIASPVANTGLLFAVAGTLNADGAVTGSGTAQIKAGVLNLAAAFGETVTFVSGATGQLRLTDFKDFTGTVAGLSTSGSNAIDMASLAFVSASTKASYSGTTAGGVLTVTNGTLTAHVSLTGNYVGHAFIVAADGHGGTLVKDPPAALAQAMASLPTPTPLAAKTFELSRPRMHALAVPP